MPVLSNWPHAKYSFQQVTGLVQGLWLLVHHRYWAGPSLKFLSDILLLPWVIEKRLSFWRSSPFAQQVKDGAAVKVGQPNIQDVGLGGSRADWFGTLGSHPQVRDRTNSPRPMVRGGAISPSVGLSYSMGVDDASFPVILSNREQSQLSWGQWETGMTWHSPWISTHGSYDPQWHYEPWTSAHTLAAVESWTLTWP